MVVTNKCQFPHDLNFAIKQLEADLGERLIANQKLLREAEAVLPGMDDLIDEGNSILDNLLSKNGAGTATSSSIVTSKDIPKQYGLLPDKPTKEDEEKFVENAGITLLDNIIYLSGNLSDNPKDSENIVTLRRLYFALGKDLKKVESILTENMKTTFVHDQLNLKIIPQKTRGTGYSVEELRKLLNQNQLDESDIAYTSDKRTVVLLKSYIALDQSKDKTFSNNVPQYELITNVFHIDGPDTSPNALARYSSLGYKDEELNSIILGDDLVNTNNIYISYMIDQLHEAASKLIAEIEFVQKRMNKPSRGIVDITFSGFFGQLILGISKLIQDHKSLICALNFEVSSFLNKEILTKLREKHTEDQIIYLLERRKDINGLFFEPTDDLFLKTLSRAVNAALPGTTYISNQAINKKSSMVYNQSNLLTMYVNLEDASWELNKKTYNSLDAAKKYLYDYINQTPLTAKEEITEFFQGQPSAASPSTILAERVDILTTMGYEQRKKDISDSFQDLYDIYPDAIAGPLSDVINAMVSIFEKTFKGIDNIITQAENTLFAMKKRLDSWLSKHASLTGQGNFSSSLLKCAINWDIGLSTDLLDQLFNFIMKFLAKMLEFISKLKAWLFDILTKILCLPVNLLNSYLGILSSALPTGCRIPKFDLGKKLNTSLGNLLKISSAKNIMLQACGKDIARLKMSISAAPDRLGQFRSSAFCESAASSNFMNASNLNVSAGVTL